MQISLSEIRRKTNTINLRRWEITTLTDFSLNFAQFRCFSSGLADKFRVVPNGGEEGISGYARGFYGLFWTYTSYQSHPQYIFISIKLNKSNLKSNPTQTYLPSGFEMSLNICFKKIQPSKSLASPLWIQVQTESSLNLVRSHQVWVDLLQIAFGFGLSMRF